MRFAIIPAITFIPLLLSAQAPYKQADILYGAAYYNEYMPAGLQPGPVEQRRRAYERRRHLSRAHG